MVELLQLYRIGKIRSKHKTIDAILRILIDQFSLEVLPFGDRQIKTLKNLHIANDHNDPFDHMVISHAITDRLILISSDRKFERYVSQRLDFVFNVRWENLLEVGSLTFVFRAFIFRFSHSAYFCRALRREDYSSTNESGIQVIFYPYLFRQICTTN